MRILPLFPAFLALAAASASVSAADKLDPKGVEFFETKIRPVLVQHCYKCHSEASGKELKGNFRLDSKAGILAGGESGEAAIIPGKPKASPMLQAMRHEEMKMPPEKKLPDEVIANFERWVAMGAPDPRAEGSAPVRAEIDIAEGRKFWAFQPPVLKSAAASKDSAWPRTEIDRYIRAGLEAKNLKPVADADRRTLIRRLSFDLVGLPPTPAEIEAFEKDASPKAIENLVDRLLASPQFGIRWGRHWLDVARYGESNGNVDNFLFPHAWRYRDYVIDAYNTDTPYDKFLAQQIAGDLLPASSGQERERNLIATGFLALTSKPRPQNNPDYAMDLVADQIEVSTTTVLGLTVACARCHDHKFDPVPQKDYYALAGIFTSTEMLVSNTAQGKKPARQGGQPTGLHVITGDAAAAEKLASHQKQVEELTAQLAAAKAKLAKLDSAGDAAKARPKDIAKGDKEAIKKARQEAKRQARLEALGKNPKQEANPQAIADAKAEVARLEKSLSDLEAKAPPAPGFAMGVRDAKRVGDTQLCIRGESQKRGDTVTRGFVSVVGGDDSLKIPGQQSGRVEFAQWLASPKNPLTARVYVNRVWHHLFGAGLVATVDNFGNYGERPSHPELLDYLALKFMEQGWSTKRLIKEIVLSRTYQLANSHDAASYAIDPDNRLLWRHASRRMEAEVLRDTMLAVSGQLNLQSYAGTAVAKYADQEVRNRITDEISRIDHSFRSVYLPAVRNATPEALELFDAADSSLIVGARSQTIVPSQALFFMNSPFVVAQAKKVAERVLASPEKDDAARIRRAYVEVLGRPASDSEVNRVLHFLEKTKEQFAASEKKQDASEPWRAAIQALFASAEFRYIP